MESSGFVQRRAVVVAKVAQVASPGRIASLGVRRDQLAERVEWQIPSRFSRPGRFHGRKAL